MAVLVLVLVDALNGGVNEVNADDVCSTSSVGEASVVAAAIVPSSMPLRRI